MNINFNLSDRLDYSEMDLTAPNIVVKKILDKLPRETKDIIWGSIDEYDGPVVSYNRTSFTATLLKDIQSEKHFDIQTELGKLGEQEKKYECYLYTSSFKEYKYRLFFMKYGIAKYPVQFTLEESIARSIEGLGHSYIVNCNNRQEVEDLLDNIITSEKVLTVMQELIRIYQTTKYDEVVEMSNTLENTK